MKDIPKDSKILIQLSARDLGLAIEKVASETAENIIGWQRIDKENDRLKKELQKLKSKKNEQC